MKAETTIYNKDKIKVGFEHVNEELAEITEATKQHFWHDENGAHISNEAGNPDGEKNSLWNSLGMLFRRYTKPIVAILTGGKNGTGEKGLKIYDGQGDDEANVSHKFTSGGARIGKESSTHVVIDEYGQEIYSDLVTLLLKLGLLRGEPTLRLGADKPTEDPETGEPLDKSLMRVTTDGFEQITSYNEGFGQRINHVKLLDRALEMIGGIENVTPTVDNDWNDSVYIGEGMEGVAETVTLSAGFFDLVTEGTEGAFRTRSNVTINDWDYKYRIELGYQEYDENDDLIVDKETVMKPGDSMIEAKGKFNCPSVASGSVSNFKIAFGETLGGVPTVIVGLATTSTSASAGRLSVSAINATEDGFTLRVFNDSGSARSPGVNWIAVV